jgi:hypothetical protein
MLSIIGTAGRGADAKKITPELWNKVKRPVYDFIIKNDHTESLISGGAALSDHLCVQLYRKNLVRYLVLALPCPFDMENCKFVEEGFRSCGNTANYYHKLYSQAFNIDSLSQIKQVILNDAEVVIGKGFLDRNLIVAKRANDCLAITFGDGPQLKDGGTAHTMRNFIKLHGNDRAYHLNLNDLVIYPNAVA